VEEVADAEEETATTGMDYDQIVDIFF